MRECRWCSSLCEINEFASLRNEAALLSDELLALLVVEFQRPGCVRIAGNHPEYITLPLSIATLTLELQRCVALAPCAYRWCHLGEVITSISVDKHVRHRCTLMEGDESDRSV